MIGQLTGTVSHKSERAIILDVNGVGYKLFLSAETLKLVRVGEPGRTLWTHLVVREDVLDLYGFLDRNELEFFEHLIAVSGIGPKSALAILSLAPPATLAKAIAAGDSTYLTRVSGIGKKNAEKIVMELKDKIADLPGENGTSLGGTAESEALEALQALGYNLRDAREALKQVGPEPAETGAKIKAALKILGQ